MIMHPFQTKCFTVIFWGLLNVKGYPLNPTLLFHEGDANTLTDFERSLLHHLGYYGDEIDSLPSGGDVSTSEVDMAALTTFQEVWGLSVTGQMDEETREFLSQPRCGNRDDELIQSRLKNRRPRFATTASWNSFNPTYRFLNYTDKISLPEQDDAIERAAQVWSDASKLNIKRTADFPDIEITFKVIEDDLAAAAYNPYDKSLEETYPYRTAPGDITFQESENWTTQLGEGTDFASVALHEMGHSLGLKHSDDPTAVMYPKYTYNPDLMLAEDDIRGIQAVYGPNPCQTSTCENNATCEKTDDGLYRCICQPEFTGVHCEVELDSYVSCLTRKFWDNIELCLHRMPPLRPLVDLSKEVQVLQETLNDVIDAQRRNYDAISNMPDDVFCKLDTLAFSELHGRYLVASAFTDGLELVDLKKSKVKTLYKEDGVEIHVAAVDWAARKAFFSSRSSSWKMQIVDICSKHVNDVLIGKTQFGPLAVDKTRREIFFHQRYRAIQRVGYDGSGLRDVIDPGCDWCVQGICADSKNQKIYYTSWKTESIYLCSYSGSCSVLTSSHMASVLVTYLDANSGVLYWGGRDGSRYDPIGKVFRIDLDSGHVTQMVNQSGLSIEGITVRSGEMYLRTDDFNHAHARTPLYSMKIHDDNIRIHEGIQLSRNNYIWGLA